MSRRVCKVFVQGSATHEMWEWWKYKMKSAKCKMQNENTSSPDYVGSFPSRGSLSINHPCKTNFRERLAVVGPSRLRELMLCQHTKVRN